MDRIKNLTIDENGWFADGTFDSRSLFKEEMKVTIFVDEGANEEDALRCIAHYNHLLEKESVLESIQKGLESFFLYMYDEWLAMEDMYSDIVKSLDSVMKGYKQGVPLISFLYKPTLYVFPQRENEIGYSIECECPWEPEHMCSILIRNEKVLYIGPSEGNDPWQEEEDYYCIWNDTDEE